MRSERTLRLTAYAPRRNKTNPATGETKMAQQEIVAKKEAVSVDPAVVEGIVASMVPIPGQDYRMGRFPVTSRPTLWFATRMFTPLISFSSHSVVAIAREVL